LFRDHFQSINKQIEFVCRHFSHDQHGHYADVVAVFFIQRHTAGSEIEKNGTTVFFAVDPLYIFLPFDFVHYAGEGAQLDIECLADFLHLFLPVDGNKLHDFHFQFGNPEMVFDVVLMVTKNLAKLHEIRFQPGQLAFGFGFCRLDRFDHRANEFWFRTAVNLLKFPITGKFRFPAIPTSRNNFWLSVYICAVEELIRNFPGQLLEALVISDQIRLPEFKDEIRNIVFLGLGGSAFGGEVVRNLIANHCPVPFFICRDYAVPEFVSNHTLAIVSSYSGNTEETLAAMKTAIGKKANVICITSGGEVASIATAGGYPCIILPGGFPPRAAAGFSIVQILFILHRYGLSPDFRPEMREASTELSKFGGFNVAREIAASFHGKLSIIYSTSGFESAAIRWRQQIEENSKQLAFHHVIPEMNHNELVGWKNPPGITSNSSVVIFDSSLVHERNRLRISIVRDLISGRNGQVAVIQPQGKTHLSQLFYLIHLGDWVSLYLSELNQEDPLPVTVIDFLKGELSRK